MSMEQGRNVNFAVCSLRRAANLESEGVPHDGSGRLWDQNDPAAHGDDACCYRFVGALRDAGKTSHEPRYGGWTDGG